MKAEVVKWIAVCALLCTAMFFAGRGCGDKTTRITTRTDTVVVYDTIRDTVPVPVARFVVRVDTVYLQNHSTSIEQDDSVTVSVPIEQKIYKTDSYRAVVEGFRPRLVEMEIYGKTLEITRETTINPRPKRWGLGVQAGWGYTIGTGSAGKGAMRPYIGVGIQYSIITW